MIATVSLSYVSTVSCNWNPDWTGRVEGRSRYDIIVLILKIDIKVYKSMVKKKYFLHCFFFH